MILQALTQELNDNGLQAKYVGQDPILPDFHAIIITCNERRICTIGTWVTHPHIIIMTYPDHKINLQDPNSIHELYAQIMKRKQQFTLIRTIGQDLQDKGYITDYYSPNDHEGNDHKLTITNNALTATIIIWIYKETPDQVQLTNPRQTIDLADPESIPQLHAAIEHRFRNALEE